VCWEVDFSLLAGVVKLLMLLCPRLFCSFLIDASLSLALIDPDLPFFLFDCPFGFLHVMLYLRM
jgi:hypothetical protein